MLSDMARPSGRRRARAKWGGVCLLRVLSGKCSFEVFPQLVQVDNFSLFCVNSRSKVNKAAGFGSLHILEFFCVELS